MGPWPLFCFLSLSHGRLFLPCLLEALIKLKKIIDFFISLILLQILLLYLLFLIIFLYFILVYWLFYIYLFTYYFIVLYDSLSYRFISYWRIGGFIDWTVSIWYGDEREEEIIHYLYQFLGYSPLQLPRYRSYNDYSIFQALGLRPNRCLHMRPSQSEEERLESWILLSGL